MSVVESKAVSAVDAIKAIVGDQYVLTDEHNCSLYAQDVYSKGLPALAVVQPADTRELAETVAATVGHGHAVIARGGGMSYTSGYVPKEVGSIVIDMSRMNRVLEINQEDMYVTVQCGCTWNDLNDALKETDLRTPYWGTLSGIRATVGGGLSQNSIFWGSGRYGTAADSVIGLEVVLADGSLVRTGSNAQQNSSPFFRHFGPDLTGLFTCDTGALGFKATATLKLIPRCSAKRFASFNFSEYEPLVRAMSEIGRAGLADECFAFDPTLQEVRLKRESIVSDVKKLAGVARSSGSVLGAIKDSARVALAGRGYMKDVQYSLHIMIEDRTEEGAESALAEIRTICSRHDAGDIEDSIPKILRANPFTPLNNVVGPRGERWLPVHTVVPHSKAQSTLTAVKEIFAKHQDLVDKHGIEVGFLLALISTNGFVIEPVFFTPDSLSEIHKDTVEEAVFKKLPGFAENLEAREATALIRQELIDLFREIGGIHMQIGKAYPYREGLRPESWRVIEQIKQALDPQGRVNPGSLGMN